MLDCYVLQRISFADLQYKYSYLIYLLMQMNDGIHQPNPFNAKNPFKLPLKLKPSNLYPYPLNSPSTKTITYDAQQPFRSTFWKFNENHSKSNHYLKTSQKLQHSNFQKNLMMSSFSKNAEGCIRIHPKRANESYEISNPFQRKNLYIPQDKSLNYQYERNMGSYSGYSRGYFNEPNIKPYSSPDKQGESSYRSSKRRENRESQGFNDSIVLNLLNPLQNKKKSSYTPLQIFKPLLQQKQSRKPQTQTSLPHNHKEKHPPRITIRGIQYHLANIYPQG